MLEGHVTVGQTQRIGCVWKPGFVNFGHIYIAGSNMPGSLQNTTQSNKEISFIQLVGAFYFKKHLNARDTHLYN